MQNHAKTISALNEAHTNEAVSVNLHRGPSRNGGGNVTKDCNVFKGLEQRLCSAPTLLNSETDGWISSRW